MFAYCGNNPVSRKDEKGELWLTIIGGALLGAAFSAGAEFLHQWHTTGSIAGVDYKSVVVEAVNGMLTGALLGSGASVVSKVVGRVAINAATSLVHSYHNDDSLGMAVLKAGGSAAATWVIGSRARASGNMWKSLTLNRCARAGIRFGASVFMEIPAVTDLIQKAGEYLNNLWDQIAPNYSSSGSSPSYSSGGGGGKNLVACLY